MKIPLSDIDLDDDENTMDIVGPEKDNYKMPANRSRLYTPPKNKESAKPVVKRAIKRSQGG